MTLTALRHRTRLARFRSPSINFERFGSSFDSARQIPEFTADLGTDSGQSHEPAPILRHVAHFLGASASPRMRGSAAVALRLRPFEPSPDRSPIPRLHCRALNLAAFSGFRRGLRGSVPRRQHFGDPRTASRENKTESSAVGLPSARVSGTAPPRLVLPAPGGCDAAGSAVTASAPPQPVAARAPRARRDPGADGPKTGTAGPGAR